MVLSLVSISLSLLHLMFFFSAQIVRLELRDLRCRSLGKKAWHANLSPCRGRVLAWIFLHQESYTVEMIFLQKCVL